jgi:16S rRNA processing protein RimM
VEKREVIPVGKIVGAHGLNGTSKVYSYAEATDYYEAGNRVNLADRAGNRTGYVIKWFKPHAKLILLALEGVTSRDQAEQLIGSEILVEKYRFPKLENGAYYWFELIGLTVSTTGGRYLGRLESIIPTGSNDVYVVRNPAETEGGNEVLIPALESVVVEIDLDEKIMRVELPEGL